MAALAESDPKAAETLRTLREAFDRPDATLWKAALKEELASLKEKRVFHVVPCLKDTKIIGVKMQIKVNAEGEIEQYKLRLVA
ncbi:hypothetical protein EDB19DRAFT_1599155, partial [Suillus lakei]